ncbi:hypothetical protein IQ266_08350 [filamentous cyanobacterium LEGE 11480]|uniref:Uncharacterized protein n=1 Tax=Romeriopsis navalis LEGE 11480 TaxID=2777977 RepID=A0A928Z3X6_9CYAN|nr:hypothetical protein [Romeriopsis navalis]MBE9029735.1 hypothetical protein [Romeriopsis navalis LEGE 11480]
MRTDYDFKNSSLFGPVAFRPEFNNFEQINVAQAWSLFFTGSNEDKIFDSRPETGRFFTQVAGVTVLAVAVWGTFFTGI